MSLSPDTAHHGLVFPSMKSRSGAPIPLGEYAPIPPRDYATFRR